MSGFWQKKHLKRNLVLFVASIVMFFVYMHIYTAVLGWELPKTRSLRRRNAALITRAEVLSHRIGEYSQTLNALQLRDEEIYRSIFGLASIPADVRESGLRRADHYLEIEKELRNSSMSTLCRQADVILKKAYLQSKSFDEIEIMLSTADNMAVSIPAICPVAPDDCYISSVFGNRRHPILGYFRLHSGIDFSIRPGSPVYVTGDGVVEKVRFDLRGYGRQVLINHGFGYKTRYAHLSDVLVTEGMKVKRGEKIATTGNTGISTGPHLHYEVIYKDKCVNPAPYFDRDITPEQYSDMLEKRGGPMSERLFVHPSHRKFNRKVK